MSILDYLASNQPPGKRGGNLNRRVAEKCLRYPKYFEDIVKCLHGKDKLQQADCAEVMAEAALIDPQAVGPYVKDLLEMVDTKNSRALWASLAAISAVANIKADEIYPEKEKLLELACSGGTITQEGAIGILGKVGGAKEEYGDELFPKLLETLKTCVIRDVPRYAEFMIPTAKWKDEFKEQLREALKTRMPEMRHRDTEMHLQRVLDKLS